MGDATTAVYRARWDGGATLADGKDIFVATSIKAAADQSIGPATGSYGARFAWDKDGLLYVSLGERNVPQTSQEPNTHLGKIVRIRDDGSVPQDNPFIGKAGYLPEIYTLGHRNPLGLYVNPITNDLWSTEEGPQGGDELNLIKAGKNYGWPIVSLGRNYDGTIVGEGFTKPGLEEPVVFWVPAIAISGLSIYNGDAFTPWKGQRLRRRDAQQHRTAHPARVVQPERRADRARDISERAQAAHPRGEAGTRRVPLRAHRRNLRRRAQDRTGAVR